jgi:pimeloyl-ACP methyl ester carboxylesterase
MNAKNRVLTACVGLLCIFSSCQKDLDVKQQDSINGEVSSDATVETSPPVWTSVVTNVNSNCAGFMQGVPAMYSQNPTKKYPLILFIHGIGELGTGVTRLNCCGLPHHMYNKTFPANFNVGGVNYSFIVIAPQFKVRPSAAQMQSVIDYAKRRWRIDETRVYVTGLSMGGGSTWDYSAVYGQNAAAIVPVAAGTKPTTTMAASIASKNLPIWGLYSSADQVVPVQWGRDFFSWIDARNSTYASKTKLTIWSDVSHNYTWARAFNPTTKVDGYNIYQWMLLYKRGSVAAAPPPPTTSGTNKAPVARAGSDQTIYLSEGVNRVTLDGTTSSDADGTISKYVWTKVSGPGANLINFGTGKTYAAQLVAGTYTFRLTVTDNKGATASDDRIVHVQQSTTSSGGTSTTSGLIARAGADKTIYLSDGIDRVTLDGTTSSATGVTITKYTWTKISGPAATLYAFANGRTYAAHLTEGTYTFRLTITSSKGTTATDDVIVHVIRTRGGTVTSTGNKVPVARAGSDKTIYLSTGVDRVTLDATASSDPDGSIVKYVWSKKSGPAADLYSFANGRTYAAHLVKGTYNFAVTITDNKGATASDNVIVYVK